MSDVLQAGRFRLSYGECDPLGIVYYGAYYRWMERIHTEWVLRSGLTQDENQRRWGVATYCRASGCEYLNPGRLFDELVMSMRLGATGRSSYTMVFDIERPDGSAVGRGTMTLVCVDRTGRTAAIPPEYLELIAASADTVDAPAVYA